MNLFKKITTGAMALTLAVGIGGGALAQLGPINPGPPDPTTGRSDVKVEIVSSGTLSVNISGHNFDQQQYSYQEQLLTAPLTIKAQDQRGTAAGWNVTLRGTDFGPAFPVGSLYLSPGSVTRVGGIGDLPTAVPASPVTVAPGQIVLSAPLGDGDGS